MIELYIVGTIILIIGILMIVFRKSWGVGFCRLGKSIFKNSPYKEWFPIDSVYDEAKGPDKFLFLGIINIIQSPIFFGSFPFHVG